MKNKTTREKIINLGGENNMKKCKFGYNNNGEESDWVRIHFINLTEEQRKHLHKAEGELLKAGVGFDTGYDFGSKTRDWEWDWSLKGAVVNIREEEK